MDNSHLLAGLVVGGVVAGVAAYYMIKPSKPAGPVLPTARQAQLVTTTWSEHVVRGVGLDVAGVLFFKTLFEQQPGAMALFKKFNKSENYLEHPEFKLHASKVIRTIDTAFGMLGDLPALVPILEKLGKAHVPYGVLPEHYNWIGQALLTTLGLGLGDQFTPEVKEAYTVVYVLVAATMCSKASY
ncbi:globin-like protein [Pavlovales sp. CCMP2436]|nr:globin-like protein [Pavlovales sp. CCMP2436]|mmetsp:Transcript_4508/g.11571  ORF Transcript_4508/g.11571 Transcript_4508/m.11571 type:complete len:185 (+) Transcript_4508:80-634(+)